MSTALALSASDEAALALLQPLIERLDIEHAKEGQAFFAQLRALAQGDVGVGSEDPRVESQLALMRQAFARQATAVRGPLFQNWSDLHNHLRFAYIPFGRGLLDLHSEAAIAQPPMDALMLAVGLAAILQQAPRSFRDGDRLLLPVQWFPAGSDIGAWLRSPRRNPALDTAYGNGLTRLDEMLLSIERGLKNFHNPSLRRGAAATLFLLRRLRLQFDKITPNVRPVRLTLWDRLLLRWRH